MINWPLTPDPPPTNMQHKDDPSRPCSNRYIIKPSTKLWYIISINFVFRWIFLMVCSGLLVATCRCSIITEKHTERLKVSGWNQNRRRRDEDDNDHNEVGLFSQFEEETGSETKRSHHPVLMTSAPHHSSKTKLQVARWRRSRNILVSNKNRNVSVLMEPRIRTRWNPKLTDNSESTGLPANDNWWG